MQGGSCRAVKPPSVACQPLSALSDGLADEEPMQVSHGGMLNGSLPHLRSLSKEYDSLFARTPGTE
jgi:hypothetical protein